MNNEIGGAFGDFDNFITDDVAGAFGGFGELVIDVGGSLGDFGEFVIEEIDGVIEEIGGAVEDLDIDEIGGALEAFGEYIVEDAISDLGEFIEEDIGSVFEDTWSWVSDDDNWAALGKTLLGGIILTFKEGEPEKAWALMSDNKAYTGEFYKKIEENKRKREQWEKEAPIRR